MHNWTRWYPGRAETLAQSTYARLVGAIEAWHLQQVTAIDGGQVAFVCAAQLDDEPVIVKVTPDVDDAAMLAEAEALKTWSRSGVVPRVFGTRDNELTMLLERLEPGAPLLEMDPEVTRRLAILGALAQRLHQPSTLATKTIQKQLSMRVAWPNAISTSMPVLRVSTRSWRAFGFEFVPVPSSTAFAPSLCARPTQRHGFRI